MSSTRGILHSDQNCEEDSAFEEVQFKPKNQQNGFHRDNNNQYNNTDLNQINGSSVKTKRKCSKRQQLVLAAFIILVVVVVVTLAVVLRKKKEWFTGQSTTIKSDRKLTLREALSNRFSGTRYQMEWVSDDSYIFTLQKSSNEILEYNVTSNTKIKIETNGDFSPDKKWLLSKKNKTKLYRYSSYADYYVQDLRNKKNIKIPTPDGDNIEQIRYCGWGRNGSALVFVYKCNIYFIPTLETNELKYYQLTNDGVPKKIFNGIPDWVYEEEILMTTNAISFSTDGRYMSFATFNASMVPFFKFPYYGSDKFQYTYILKIAYPKAGHPNPTIRFSVVDIQKVIETNDTKQIIISRPQVPTQLQSGEHYYCVMKWTTANKLYIQWINRSQNQTFFVLYNLTDNIGRVIKRQNTPKGWIENDYIKPYFSTNGSYYLTMLPNEDFRHLAKVSTKEPFKTEFLTSGNYTVADIKCYNQEKEIVYFRSTERSPRSRDVYSINIKTKEKKCITCGLVKDGGEECTYFEVDFSTKCSYVKLGCEGPIIPKDLLLNLKTMTLTQLTNASDYEILKKKLKDRDIPTARYYTIKSDGFDIHVKELRPVNFDKNKKYAVLLDVYGGPGTQKVDNVFRIGLSHYFPSTHNIIYVLFDARGSGAYGYKFMYAVYKKLGYYESKDAIAVARHYQRQKYVDPNKIAIWGWSYGGFYSATTLAMSGDAINTAVSVAPVTDWRYYDSIYSERYMGLPTPEDNLEGYKSTSVMSMAKNFRGKNFLLIHGTADDNVHFQNAAKLSKALVKAKVKFRNQFYTDKGHRISSSGHVFYLITDYLLSHLTDSRLPSNSTFGL